VTNLSFDNLPMLHLGWGALAVFLIGLYGIWQRRRAVARFASSRLMQHLAPSISVARRVVRLGVVALALILLVIALTGPRWGEQAQNLLRRNIDIVVLLDVSKSMLARDIAPNRLERAKLAIRDDLLPALGGDRVALVAFAGEQSVACPLTSDYGFFRLALDDITTQSSPRGGTLIGDAIRRAAELFDKKLDTHKLILLITDGEDHDSYPIEAAAGVWKDGKIPVVALAIGDPQQGARIPVGDPARQQFLQYKGETHWSRADFEQLRRVAESSPLGVFVPVGTSNFDLGGIYRTVASALRTTERQEQQVARQPPRFHGFVVAALLLVLLESLLREAPRRALLAIASRDRGGRAAAVLVLATLLAGPQTARAEETFRDLVQRGNDAFNAGDYEGALKVYAEAENRLESKLSYELLHNQAATHFKLGQLDEARERWMRATQLGDALAEARARYNLGNVDYAEALRALQDQKQQGSAKAKEHLGKAAASYRDAVRLDPQMSDARANLELTQQLRREIERLEQQQSQQQQGGNDPNAPRDPNAPHDPNQQQQQQQQNQDQQHQQEQQQSDAQSQEQQQSQQGEQQQQDEQQSEAEQREQQERQQSEEQKGQEGEQSQAVEAETQPATTQPAEQAQTDPNQPQSKLTDAQAERMLQMVRDAERARREALAKQRQSKQEPVDRDW
jgi:Ca-activated chloride channel family protein